MLPPFSGKFGVFNQGHIQECSKWGGGGGVLLFFQIENLPKIGGGGGGPQISH